MAERGEIEVWVAQRVPPVLVRDLACLQLASSHTTVRAIEAIEAIDASRIRVHAVCMSLANARVPPAPFRTRPMSTRRTRSRTAFERSLVELLSDDELSCVVEHCKTSSLLALHECNRRFVRLAGAQLRRTALTFVMPGKSRLWPFMGQFQLKDELFNGRPAYYHTTDPTCHMYYTAFGTWWVGVEDDDDTDSDFSFDDDDDYRSVESMPGSILPTQVIAWRNPYEYDTVISGMQCLDALMVASELQAAVSHVAIVGSPPNGWCMNKLGYYTRREGLLVNGRPVFSKGHADSVLSAMLWHTGKHEWIVGKRCDLGTEKGFLRVNDSSLLPVKVQAEWKVVVPRKLWSKCGTWRKAPKVQVQPPAFLRNQVQVS